MGWARANVLYEKARKPPEPGSPTEALFLLLWKMRQEIEFQKSRSTLQAFLSQKGAEDKEILKAFNDLKEAFFPFDKNQRRDEIRALKDAMQRELTRGPLTITPLEDITRKSVKGKLSKGEQALAKREQLSKEGRLTALDVFEQAHRRPRPRGAF